MGTPIQIGIDICSVRRIQRAIEQHGHRFLNWVFTQAEQDYCNRKRNKYENYAARFASKEAVLKAKKGGRGRFGFRKIEVVRGPNGAPSIHISKSDRNLFGISPAARFELTITHEREFAVAAVLLFP